MLIDVQDASLNLILNGCLLGILAITAISLIPWTLRGGRNRWTHILPLLGLAAYGVYELAMPTRMNIRADLLLVWLLLALILLAWIFRLVRIRRLKRNLG